MFESQPWLWEPCQFPQAMSLAISNKIKAAEIIFSEFSSAAYYKGDHGRALIFERRRSLLMANIGLRQFSLHNVFLFCPRFKKLLQYK
jgi:hypothetical protein